MRFFTATLAIASIVLTLAACTGKSSSSSDQSSSDQTSATATTGAEATAAASTDTAMNSEATTAPSAAAFSGKIPDYPGATTRSSTSEASATTTHAYGRVLETSDAFDKVYAFYQKNMPAGSERLHMTQPAPSALFAVVAPDRAQDSVAITVVHGKTVITIGHVTPAK